MSKPNTLVVVVDTQVDFVMRDGLLSIPNAEAILAPGIRFLSSLDPREVAGVLFTFDTHVRDEFMGSPENLGDPANGIPGFDMHCEQGTPGWANVFNPDLVHPSIPVWMLRKGVFDMWEEPSRDVRVYPVTRQGEDGYSWGQERDFFFHGHTGADGTHDLLARGHEIEGVDTIRVIGVASDYCVRWAIAGFLDRGFKVEVHAPVTAGINADVAATVIKHFPGRVSILPPEAAWTEHDGSPSGPTASTTHPAVETRSSIDADPIIRATAYVSWSRVRFWRPASAEEFASSSGHLA